MRDCAMLRIFDFHTPAQNNIQITMRTRFSVFLITLSGLILEVGLTRIYSASIWYHFAFVAISVALLGWGLGGFTVHLIKQGLRQKGIGGRESGAGKVEIRGQRSEVGKALLSPAPRAEEN